MIRARRDSDRSSRYSLPDYSRPPSPVSQAPQHESKRDKLRDLTASKRSEHAKRFLSVSAADFVLLPLAARLDDRPQVLGPITAAARPPSYELRKTAHPTASRAISRRPASERLPDSAQWSRDPFLIEDTTHADKIDQIVTCSTRKQRPQSEIISATKSNSASVLSATSLMTTSTGTQPSSSVSLQTNETAVCQLQNSRTALQDRTHKRQSMPSSAFRSLASDAAHCTTNNTSPKSSTGKLHESKSTTAEPDGAADIRRQSAPILVVPDFVPKEVFVNLNNPEPEGSLEFSTVSEAQRRALLRHRERNEALYDLDDWSDAVDTIGTETWPEVTDHRDTVSGSADRVESPVSSDPESSPLPEQNDPERSGFDESASEPSASLMRKSDGEKPKPDSSATGVTNQSELFVQSDSLRTLLEVTNLSQAVRPRSPDRSSDNSDLDFKFQDVEEENAKSAASGIGREQLTVSSPSIKEKGRSADEVHHVERNDDFQSLVLSHPPGPRHLFLGTPGIEGERYSVGDVVAYGNQKIVPYSPTSDPDDGSGSSREGSNASRKFFGMAAHRFSDESDELNSFPSGSFYANDEYDKFCIRNNSPLKPKRNSYINRILTGEVRERPQSRSSQQSRSSTQSRSSQGETSSD